MPATIWKGNISFGLVSFPVRLFSAARAESIHFHLLHRTDLSRLRQVWYCAEENEPIERSDIVKGFEAGDGKYVVLEENELKKIAPPTATTMEILQFVSSDEVDPMFFESSYYVAPGDKSPKPYNLFAAALADTGKSAIAQVAMHNREHVVLIRPSGDGLLLHTLYYPDELHSDNQAAVPQVKFTAKELELAKSLISHLSAPFAPEEFKDTYRENLERLIEQKQKGRKITLVKQPRKAPVIDLMEALKRSLNSAPREKTPRVGHRAAAKKPAKRRTAA